MILFLNRNSVSIDVGVREIQTRPSNYSNLPVISKQAMSKYPQSYFVMLKIRNTNQMCYFYTQLVLLFFLCFWCCVKENSFISLYLLQKGSLVPSRGGPKLPWYCSAVVKLAISSISRFQSYSRLESMLTVVIRALDEQQLNSMFRILIYSHKKIFFQKI